MTKYWGDQILGDRSPHPPSSDSGVLTGPNAIIHFLDVLTVAWGANISKLLALLIFPTKTQI